MDESLLRPAIASPRRIWIVGPSGSGKSTLSSRVADRLGIEATSLDDLHWEPGWIERSPSDLVDRLRPIVARPAWVIEGNYGAAQLPFLDCTDLFVWLDFPIATTVSRVLVRSVSRAFRGTPCCNGNRESLARAFLRRDSIILWAISSHRRNRRRYAKRFVGRPHVRLRTPYAVTRWLATLGVEPPHGTLMPRS